MTAAYVPEDAYYPAGDLGAVAEAAARYGLRLTSGGLRTDEQIMADARAYLAGVRAREAEVRRIAEQVTAEIASWAESCVMTGSRVDDDDEWPIIRSMTQFEEEYGMVAQSWRTYVAHVQIVDAPGLRAWWRRRRFFWSSFWRGFAEGLCGR